MKTLKELDDIKNTLPRGSIYKKKIKDNFYYYHQYRENGENFSIEVVEKNLDEMLEKIKLRKSIEKQIKELLRETKRDLTLSKYAREYTGYVMLRNKKVAEFDKGQLVYKDNKFCPLIIKRTNSLINFLKSRTIDLTRTNSRLLRKALDINEHDETLISLCSYAATVSDKYWFKPKHSKLRYKDVAFNNDIFFETALKGIVTSFPKKIVLTPELTTNGSYEKGWRLIDKEWWLFKVGTKEEIYSEMFYSRLFEKLNLPTAIYEIDGNYIKTKNFAHDVNFEPLSSIADDNVDIDYLYNLLNKIDHNIALDYLRLSFFDVVMNNVDRHNENSGLLRDIKTGKIISLSPNYDDNMCLISRNKNLIIDEKEGFLHYFVKLIKSNPIIKNALREIDFPIVNEQILEEVHNEININIEIDFALIKDFILFRYQKLLNIINN